MDWKNKKLHKTVQNPKIIILYFFLNTNYLIGAETPAIYKTK